MRPATKKLTPRVRNRELDPAVDLVVVTTAQADAATRDVRNLNHVIVATGAPECKS
jgi:hypothetical protein